MCFTEADLFTESDSIQIGIGDFGRIAEKQLRVKMMRGKLFLNQRLTEKMTFFSSFFFFLFDIGGSCGDYNVIAVGFAFIAIAFVMLPVVLEHGRIAGAETANVAAVGLRRRPARLRLF